jgi:predicted DNA-binding protein
MAKSEKKIDKKHNGKHVSLRLQDGTEERVDALLAAYSQHNDMAKYGPWTKHRLLRVALETGLDILEDKVGKDGGKRKS